MIYRSSAQQPCSNKSTHSSRFIHPYVLSFFFLLQVFRPFCQNTWGPGLCRQLSATLVVMRRASLCAGTMTAGASAPRTTHSVIAPRWIWGLWKSVCWKSETPGTWPTKSLRSQVSVFFFNECDPPTDGKLDPIVRAADGQRKRGTIASNPCNWNSSVHRRAIFKAASCKAIRKEQRRTSHSH